MEESYGSSKLSQIAQNSIENIRLQIQAESLRIINKYSPQIIEVDKEYSGNKIIQRYEIYKLIIQDISEVTDHLFQILHAINEDTIHSTDAQSLLTLLILDLSEFPSNIITTLFINLPSDLDLFLDRLFQKQRNEIEEYTSIQSYSHSRAKAESEGTLQNNFRLEYTLPTLSSEQNAEVKRIIEKKTLELENFTQIMKTNLIDNRYQVNTKLLFSTMSDPEEIKNYDIPIQIQAQIDSQSLWAFFFIFILCSSWGISAVAYKTGVYLLPEGDPLVNVAINTLTIALLEMFGFLKFTTIRRKKYGESLIKDLINQFQQLEKQKDGGIDAKKNKFEDDGEISSGAEDGTYENLTLSNLLSNFDLEG